MKAARFIWFFIMIAAGIAIGLYYTWMVNPVNYVDATFFDLRQDYKADYVLMVAEIYDNEPVLLQTMMRLDRLMETSPETAVENAIVNAGQLGYSQHDVELLYQLNDAIGGNLIDQGLDSNQPLKFNPPNLESTSLPVLWTPTPEEINPFLNQGVQPVAPPVADPTIDNPFVDGGDNG
jgi:hypothetical protein